jgi:DNA-binding NarL/FixJ family response regulator
MSAVIVGRAEEASTLRVVLADPRPEPRALLLEGEPGIGKTTLYHELLANARDHAILSCRPTRSEMDLSYVALVELLGGVPDAILEALPGPQARVLRMILRREEPEGRFDRLSLGVATVAAVRALAADRPVLLAVDDAQWLDHPSARTLAFVARRLSGTAVRIAIVRSAGGWQTEAETSGGPVDWATELGRAMPEGRLDVVRLGPVGASELSRILRRALGWVPAWPRVVRIAELSGGNPLYAVELARAIGSAQSTADLDGPLPAGPLELARARIARLPEHARAVVELASVARAPSLDLIHHLDPSAPEDAVAVAQRGGILSVDGDRIGFTHPILAAAAYSSIPLPRRRILHHAVAMVSHDLEERARHLATAADGPDRTVAATLDEAAERAWRRGAPDAAADLLRLACRLTPPADTVARVERRIAYGRLLHGAGDAPGAVAELESIVSELPPGVSRARALHHLMYVTRLSGSLERALVHGVRAAEEAAADPVLQAQVYEMLSRLSDNDIALKLDTARRGLDAVDRLPDADPEVVFHVRAALVEAEFYAGLGIHLERLDGIDPGDTPRFPPLRTATRGDDLVGRLLAYDGRFDEGLGKLRGLYERASVEGRSILPAVLGWMAEAEIMAGRFPAAHALTLEAIDRAAETGATEGTPWEVGFHAVALARLGRLDEAEAAAARVLRAAGADPGFDGAPARLALGVVALSRSRFEEAVTQLRLLDRAKRDAGLREPRVCAHAAELVEALVGAGELTEAAEVLARFSDEAASSAGQWSLAAATRCRALLLAAHGDVDAALDAAQLSVSAFEGLPMPFERARSVLVLGQVHRRRREKRLAREALAEALATFERLGTPVWAERARADLARIPQQRDADVLTPTEERIARLAVEGLTNKEIADRIFLSPKTVEVNLTRIYRKLGVRSRTVLAQRLPLPRPQPQPTAEDSA